MKDYAATSRTRSRPIQDPTTPRTWSEVLSAGLNVSLTRFNLVLWLMIAIVLTVAGPFGTYSTVDYLPRFLFWVLVVPVSSTLGYMVNTLTRYKMRRFHPVVMDLTGTALMVIFFTPILYALILLLVTQPDSAGPSYVMLMVYSTAVSFFILTGRRLVPGLEAKNYLPKSHDANRPRLMRRLPGYLHGEVLRLSSQDHFVDVVTCQGTERIRIRLADAIDEMDGVEGFLTHRSHWVAAAAVKGVERDGPRLQLRLQNGDLVPVSRTYRAEFESLGML